MPVLGVACAFLSLAVVSAAPISTTSNAPSTAASSNPATVNSALRTTVLRDQVSVSRPVISRVRLAKDEVLEISARLLQPGALSPNARCRVKWQLVQADDPKQVPRLPAATAQRRAPDAFGIYTAPTADWTKLLHALDGDVYVVYRAPAAGEYELSIRPETDEVDLFQLPRWREKGAAPQAVEVPRQVAWKGEAKVEVTLRGLDVRGQPEAGMWVEAEPNDTPEQAQSIPLRATADDYSLYVTGTSDDIEYFDNGRAGSSGDDWFRLEFKEDQPRQLSACLAIPDQQVAARIRCYVLDPAVDSSQPGTLLPVKEYDEGRNPNERAHQQEEQHRIAINRTLKPGGTYFLRIEANAPGYELELRVVRPAPFEDPRQAVRHALYDHIGQVESWLANRPRGASVERRIRDTGNLLGTHCMSCHTQSGVWGPAVPFAEGYRPQNAQLFRQLMNTCYQSLRPTNELVDAASNTSLAPLDLGDAPAGSRVAGHAVTALERYYPVRKLQSKQAIRAANYVLQTGDPGGINADGPGANVGQAVVFHYAGEILWSAWKATGHPEYFRGLEERARKMLDLEPKFTDDIGHRVEFLLRYFPRDYAIAAAEVAAREAANKDAPLGLKGTKKPVATSPADAKKLQERIEAQIASDLARLRTIQKADGGWGFDPGKSTDGGKTWMATVDKADPAPTALALSAFQAAGIKPEDVDVARGVKALLAMQHPTGYWNASSQTGFITTSYALHTLSRLFPVEPPKVAAARFAPKAGETLIAAIRRVRDASYAEDPQAAPFLVEAAKHESPLVRYWAMVGLGALHLDAGAKPLAAGLADMSKPVREAAQWGLRQTLIDDRGWDELFAALGSSDDYSRETATRALMMRVDGVLTQSRVGWQRLTTSLEHGINSDPHPAVRAWSARAAVQWWIWNPPVRSAINDSWVRRFSRPEENTHVENAFRYQSHALFVVNGHKANKSGTHQYAELKSLFSALDAALKMASTDDPQAAAPLALRLVAVSATFYETAGGDGGPGQLGYSTPGANELFGRAALRYLAGVELRKQDQDYLQRLRLGLEGSANISHEALQEKLIDFSLHGPEALRSVAAASVSDPGSVQLVAVPELIEPLMVQVLRGAAEPARRAQLSEPILKLFSRVRWNVPQLAEQQRQVLKYLIPTPQPYRTPSQLKAIADPVARQTAERQQESDWYLATGLGQALADNPDLHIDTAVERLPDDFSNPIVAQYWLPNVPWILTHKTQLPDVAVGGGKLPPADPFAAARTRSLQMFVTQMGEETEPRNRELAVKLANATALRRNPEVLTALEALVKFEKREPVVKSAANVLSTGRNNFLKELASAAKAESVKQVALDAQGEPILDESFVKDFSYFRDYVFPEMTRVQRADERSCIACHGVPGRVPSLELVKPDEAGFLPMPSLLRNYRLLQGRVDLTNLESSKLLRKPLNVQSGQEDGHQGGRRYQPTDAGYRILRNWVLNQPNVQRQPKAAKGS